MTVRRWLAVAIWLAVAGVTAWAIAARPVAISHSELVYEPFLAYALGPGTSADFIVPNDVDRVRLISRSALPEDALARVGDPLDYPIRIAWLDARREVVLEHTFWESSGVSRMPGPGLSAWQNAWLQDSSDLVTDDRVTLVPMATIMPSGGYMRITAPEEGGTLYVRLYGEEIRGRIDAGLALFGPTTQLQQGLLNRIGLPRWTLLDRGERRALARTVWRSLAPDAATREVVEPRWIMRSELRLSSTEQRLAWQVLGAGRSVALGLVGPAALKLSGQPEIGDLDVEWVGLSDTLVVESAATPVRFAGASRARQIQVPEGPGSLVFRNPTGRPVGPLWWSLDHVGADTLFGRTEAARIADMAPQGTWRADDVVLIGPEWNLLDTWRASDGQDLSWSGAWPPGGDVLQLLVRAVLGGADDLRPRTLRVTGWDALGRKVWSDAATYEPEPAPFEHLIGSEAWISEPIRTWVPVDARITRLTVTTRDDLLLILRAQGAPQGDPDFYALPDDQLRVRYGRRPVTAWKALDPDGDLAVTQRTRVGANVRLVRADAPTAAPTKAPVDRWYTTLTPVEAPRPDRIWLVPPKGDDDTPRPLYCAFAPGTAPFSRDATAVDRLDGVLAGTLWTPGLDALGALYQVSLDGETWQEGILAQRVYAFRTGREPPRSTLHLEAPPGSTLWMRTWSAPGRGCPDPHEGRRYWHLDPGERIVFEVSRTLERQVFALSTLGPPEASVWVHFDDGQTATSGLHESWTKRQRELILAARAPVDDARPLEDPDTHAVVLESRGLVLGSNLAGDTQRITVQNLAAAPIQVRGLLETVGPRKGDYSVDEMGLIRVDTEGEQ